MSKLVDINRLFSNVLPHVGDKSRIVEELVENSVRAGANKIDISLSSQGILTCTDDGVGVSDWCSLIKVADTGHSDFVVTNENPAGMGMLMMIAACHSVEISSHSDTLFIERAQFFNLPSYRDELIAKAEAINANATTGGGCCMKLFLTPGNAKGVRNVLQNGVPEWLGYYPVDITFNNVPVTRLNVDWNFYRNGEGDMVGTRIGIAKGLQGAVFWHGKYIKCEELAPFTVEVFSKTPVIKPGLPDRTRIDNDAGTLDNLHGVIEAQLFDQTQAAFKEDDGQQWLSLLLKLKCKYDVSDWVFWGEVVETFHGGQHVQKKALSEIKHAYSKYTSIVIKHKSGEMDDCDLSVDSEFELIDKRINNTSMPKAFKAIYHDVLTFEADCDINQNNRQYDFGRTTINVFDTITFAGNDVSHVVLERDDCVFIADLEGFFDSNDLSDYYSWEGIEIELLELECARILSADKGGFSDSVFCEFKRSVTSLVSGESDRIKEINCNVSKNVITVVFDDGEKRVIPIC